MELIMQTQTTHTTQKQKYLDWYVDAKKNKNLIDVKLYAGETMLFKEEEIYRELNHFNDQLDRTDIKPLFEYTA
jgi:sulfatase maturation enzyme AslB (radical SAM superfamily)